MTAHFSYWSSLISIQEIITFEWSLNMTFWIVSLTKLSNLRASVKSIAIVHCCNKKINPKKIFVCTVCFTLAKQRAHGLLLILTHCSLYQHGPCNLYVPGYFYFPGCGKNIGLPLVELLFKGNKSFFPV